jgi:hypothetical protein
MITAMAVIRSDHPQCRTLNNKTIMTKKNLTMAALVLMMTACSNDYNEAALLPSDGYEITVTATVDAGGSTLTRTVTESGSTIISSLTADEQIAVLFSDGSTNLNRTATVKNVTDGQATIEFTIPSTLANNTAATLVYPATAANTANTNVKTYAELFATQTGALSDALDVRRGTATILNDGTTASLSGATKLAAQNAIVKFSLQDAGGTAISASSFVIKDGSDNVITTVTPSAATSDLCVAMAPASAADFNFSATVGTEAYTYAKTGVTLAAGTYYQSPIKMTFTKHSGTIEFSKESDSQTWSATATENTYQLAATVTGDGAVTYSVNADNTCGATINASTGALTFTKVGTVTVTATIVDSETYTYASNTASYTLTINPATMTVTANDYSGTYDTNAHGITVNAPTGATVKYGTTADNCTLTSLTYTDAGTYTVYYKVTMDNYTPATGSATVTINKAAGSISFPAATSEHVNDDNAFDYPATITGDGTITGYSSSNINVATVDKNGRVTIVSTGTAIITATVADGTNYTYSPNSATYTLTVKPGGLKVPSTYNDGGDPF